MRTNACVGCEGFPCQDVNHAGYRIPGMEVDPQKISIVLISEAAPQNPADYYDAPGNPFFVQTTVEVFKKAGAEVNSLEDILNLGVYCTTAVKCSKTGYNLQTSTIIACSALLEAELNLFPNVKAYLLMGDVAIKAVNAIAKRAGQPRVIPAGPTYKIRGGHFTFRGVPAFPSYLQVGPSFFIEKGKHQVVAADIAAALAVAVESN